MGLKSLILLNKTSTIMYHNSSFLDTYNYNRYFYFFLFLKKFFYNSFNNFFLFSIFLNTKNKINTMKIRSDLKVIFFGKIVFFIFQGWYIIKINSFLQKKKNIKIHSIKLHIFKILKKTKIEL